MAKMTEMRELLTHELGDLLYAERRFLTATRRLEREAEDPEIKARLEQHVGETEKQIERLDRAFQAIGEKAKAEKCEAAIGLREEHDSFKSEEKPSKEILQAFDLGSGLRVEHYEIAAYRSAIAVARVLGENECAEILGESLAEEESMANFIEKNAAKALKKLHAKMKAG
jgi:ferritin-like metal-binding protein YciE